MNDVTFCGNRLPCGLCMITHTQCPYASNTIEITCKVSE